MSEYDEIIKWHPQLMLISENPVTWYGLLNVNNNTHMTIKLKVPKYPRMKRATILFDEKISLTHGTDFSSKISLLLKNSNSVMTFLSQLQKLLDNIIKLQINDGAVNINWRDHHMLDEIKNALTIPEVTIAASDTLNLIKIIYKEISIILKRNTTTIGQWSVVSSDLPQLQNWQLLESCTENLNEAIETLKTRVDTLEDTWANLREIDENSWVLDPVNPKPCHLHRRIFLNPALSLLITLNPLNLDAVQEIKILGSEKEVVKCEDLINSNLYKWTTDKTVVENLQDLLDLPELPKAPTITKISESDGIFTDKECCICFLSEGDDGELPSVVCNNEKCRKDFHNYCLQQWLQIHAESSIAFNRIHGACPNCKTKISCRITNN